MILLTYNWEFETILAVIMKHFLSFIKKHAIITQEKLKEQRKYGLLMWLCCHVLEGKHC